MANTAVTLTKPRFTPLTNPERSAGFTHKWTILYSDIAFGAGATDTVTVTLGASSPTNWIVTQAFANITTVFAGTTGGLAVTAGTSGSVAAFLPSTSVLAAGVVQPTTGPNTVATPGSAFGQSVMVPTVVFTNSVSGSPAGVTSGQLDVFLSIIDRSQMG